MAGIEIVDRRATQAAEIGSNEVEIITNNELAAYFAELKDAIRALREAKSAPHAAQDYYTRTEAAQYLRIGTTKLDELARAGAVRRAKIGTGDRAQVLYRKRDLDDFVEQSLEKN